MPPPPPGGESTKYVVVVVVLAVGLGALLFWKNCGEKPTPPVAYTPTSSVPTTTTAPPAMEQEVPPPPDLPEAGPDGGGGTHVISNGPGPGICDQTTCSGVATSDLQTALAFRAKQAHRCYDTALAQDPSISGHVKIGVRVASNGMVCSASVAANDLANPNVGSCIANMFRQSGHFPPPKGGCIDANVPIALMPPGQR